MIVLFILLLILSAFCEAVWNIALFRASMSWLPIFGTVRIEYLAIQQDQFHWFKGLQITMLLWFLFIVVFGEAGALIALLGLPGIWLIYYGILFPYLYHILLIKPEHWRYEIWKVWPLNWFRYLK